MMKEEMQAIEWERIGSHVQKIQLLQQEIQTMPWMTPEKVIEQLDNKGFTASSPMVRGDYYNIANILRNEDMETIECIYDYIGKFISITKETDAITKKNAQIQDEINKLKQELGIK